VTVTSTEPSTVELRLLRALAWMCEQYLRDGKTLDHECMHAGEVAVDLLAEYGLLKPGPRGGTWTEAGRKLLDLI
jgi:hypothetical protein